MRSRIYWIYALVCFIWGSTFVVMKMGLEQTPPIFGVSLRYLTAAAIMAIIIKVRGYAVPLDRESIKAYAVVGFLNFGLSYSLTYSGTQYIYSNISALLWASVPITTALTAHFFLPKERLTIQKSVGIIIGFAGVALIFASYGFGESSNLLLGMTLVMGGVLAGTWPSVYLKIHPSKANPLVLTAVAALMGGTSTLITSLILERDLPMAWTPENLGIIFYLALVGTVVAWGSYYYLLENIAVVKLSFIGFIAPILAMFMGMIVLDEYLPSSVYFGAALVWVGIFTADAKRYLAALQGARK